jgi:hypothetical protein
LAWNKKLLHHNIFYEQIRAIQNNQPITPFVSFVKHWLAENRYTVSSIAYF